MENNYEVCSLVNYWNRDVSTYRYFYDFLSSYEYRQLIRIIENPMIYNKELRDISLRLYSSCGILRNTIDYMKALPTLDYVTTSYIKDGKTKANKEIFNYALKKMKHDEIMRDAILKGCTDGIAFYYFDSAKRKSSGKKSMSRYDAEIITEINNASEMNALKKRLAEINISVISLPTDYCRIVGIKNNSYEIAFDLNYFGDTSEPVDNVLRRYPKEIRDGYAKWINGKGQECVILDNTKTIVHKISSKLDEPWGRPLVLAAIMDILYSDKFRNTKQNVLDNINNQIIYQTFPEGKTAGTSSLSNDQQEQQHEAVKGAVLNKNSRGGISFFSVAAGTKIDSIKVDTNLLDNDYDDDLNTKIGTDLGFAASLLNASGTTSFSSQQTNLDLVTAQIFEWISQISKEFNKVINYNIIGNNFIDVEANYLPITKLNRKENFNYAKDLFTTARGSLAYVAACAGLSKEVFFSMLDEQQEEGWLDKYPVNATSFNTSGDKSEESKSGRPTLEETGEKAVNESTLRTRANNTNKQPKPSNS